MEEREKLEQAMARLEAERGVLGDGVVDTATAGLRERLYRLDRAPAPSEPAQVDVSLVGERKLVTIMFADVSGFTALAESMDAESVREIMNSCFEHLVPIIRKYEWTVDKFIGDEIMALFGAPLAHENDPELALLAALEMKEALAAYNRSRGLSLGLHFGVNTGSVIAGGIGARDQKE